MRDRGSTYIDDRISNIKLRLRPRIKRLFNRRLTLRRECLSSSLLIDGDVSRFDEFERNLVRFDSTTHSKIILVAFDGEDCCASEDRFGGRSFDAGEFGDFDGFWIDYFVLLEMSCEDVAAQRASSARIREEY